MEEDSTSGELSKFGIAKFLSIPFFVLLDLTTDTYSVVFYWRDREQLNAGLEIAIFSTISLVLGYFTGIMCILVFIDGKDRKIATWKKNIKEQLALWRMAEVTFETLPQFVISLYTLAIGFLEHQDIERGILYFSSVESWISMSLVMSNFDEVLQLDNTQRKFTVAGVEKLLLYGCKSVMLLARLFLIVFMVVRIGWWTALFTGSHLLLVAIIMACIYRKSIFRTLLLSLFFVFSWLSGEDNLLLDGSMLVVFSVEHVVGFVVSAVRGNNNPFYLLSHFLEIYISISVFAVVLFTIYLLSRKYVGSSPVGPR